MNRKVNSFVTSDWHIGHANVISFSKRPFTDVDHMARVLINNYNSCVKPDDVCFFLGDMGLTKGEDILKVVQKLNGHKIFIRGNHDKKGDQFWYACGFSAVLNMASVVIARELVTMTHCPLLGIKREETKGMRGAVDGEAWHGEARHGNRFSIPDMGQYHCHGHIHSPNGGKSVKILDRQYDVGVDANKYRPVSFSHLESWITTHKKGLIK